MVSHGCYVNGYVRNSVLSPGVVVEEGAIVRDSIVMFDTVIGRSAVLDHAIIDKEVIIGPSTYIGFGDDLTPNATEPQRLTTGITLVGKRAQLPEGVRIGRNCRVDPDVVPEDFDGLELASGGTVLHSGSAH